MINQFDKYKSSDETAQTEQAEQIDEQIDQLATELNSPNHRMSIDLAAFERVASALERQSSVVAATPTEPTLLTPIDEKGPIEYFTRTKEALRHVMQPDKSVATPSKYVDEPNGQMNGTANADVDENVEDYVKIPVQQLINTFEKQMRSIINQQINDTIPVKGDKGTALNKVVLPPWIASNGIADDTNIAPVHRTSVSNGHTNGNINTNGSVTLTTEQTSSKFISTESINTVQQHKPEQTDNGFSTIDNGQTSNDRSQWRTDTEQINVDSSTMANGTIDINANVIQCDRSNGGKPFQFPQLFPCCHPT